MPVDYNCDPCTDPACENLIISDDKLYKRFIARMLCAIENLMAGGGGGLAMNVNVLSSTLPTGAATEATLATLNGKITACNTGAVVIASSGLPTGAATEVTLSSLNGKVTSCNTGAIAGNVGVTSLPATSISAETADATVSGNNTIYTPAGGNQVRLYYISLSAASDNIDAVTAIVKFGAAGTELYEVSLKPGAIWARNIGAGRRYIEGGIDDPLVVNLSDNQTVHVSFEYEEV